MIGLVGLWMCEAVAAQASRKNHAVLVGVSEYPGLGERFRLLGPAHDVDAMGDVLVDRFGFHPADIVKLSETAGSDRPDRLPTRANILRELDQLVLRVGPGHRVVVLLAGHGSQQPAANDEGGSEAGGLDEIFLPRDAEPWRSDPEREGVPNAVVDDELGVWLSKIQATGAEPWIIFDCCHSGDLARSVPGSSAAELERSVPPEWLAIPPPQQNRLARREGAGVDATLENATVLYACQSHEKTVERRLPGATADAPPCGLLTSTLVQILRTTPRPLSHRELTREIQRSYRGEGRFHGPTPYCEGDVARAVLTDGRLSSPSFPVSRESASRLRIDAGLLDGLAIGDILEVRAPDDDSAGVLGHVRVGSVEMGRATVEPVAHAAHPAVEPRMLDGGRAAVVVAGIGDARLCVAVASRCPPGLVRGLEECLDSKAGPGRIVRLVATADEPAWLVDVGDDCVMLTPRQVGPRRSARRYPLTGGSTSGGAGDAASLAGAIAADLVRIARAEGLLRASARCRTSRDAGLDLRLEIAGRSETVPESCRLAAGDRFLLALEHHGERPVDVTVLHVDADHVLQAVFPDQLRGESSRLESGDIRRLALRCHGDEAACEWLVVLAVNAVGAPVDFTGLAASGSTRSAALGPMAALLEAALGDEPATRGMARDEADACYADVIRIEIREAQSP